MRNIIKVTDTSIDVAQIMQEIEEKAASFNQAETDRDISYIRNNFLKHSEPTSPNILEQLNKPLSKKSGTVAKFNNKILNKFYYIIWNTLGAVLVKQQDYNNYLENTVKELDNKITNKTSNSNLDYYSLVEFLKDKKAGRTDDIVSQVKSLAFKGSKVLVLGCKDREVLKMLRDEKAEYIGVGESIDLVTECRQDELIVDNKELIEFLEQDEDFYDLVIIPDELEHYSHEDIYTIFRLAYLRLKSEGKLLVSALNPNHKDFHGLYSLDFNNRSILHPLMAEFFTIEAGFNSSEITKHDYSTYTITATK